MNIENYLKKWKKRIDKGLIQYLPSPDTYPPTLSRAMRYTVLAGGKRIRSILLLTIYQLCGGKDIEEVIPVSCAIEFIHSYSLIHDDLPAIDNDNYRRGIATSHLEFGEDIAILAGDALFSHAFYVITNSDITPQKKEKIFNILTTTVGNKGVIGGQIKDVETHGIDGNPGLLRYIHSHKTASFFSAVCEMGGVLAGVDAKRLIYLRKGGLFMGMSFQIIDDILDIQGVVEETGKDVNSDENKLTYPYLYGVKRSKDITRRYSQISINCFREVVGKVEILEEIILLLLGRIK